MERLMELEAIIKDVLKTVGELDISEFEMVMCMLCEEYCFKHKLNMVKTFNEMNDVVNAVNAEEGPYNPDNERKVVTI